MKDNKVLAFFREIGFGGWMIIIYILLLFLLAAVLPRKGGGDSSAEDRYERWARWGGVRGE